MKVLSVPSSGKRGNIVAYISPFGQIHRELVSPTNPRTIAQQYMRGVFGHLAQAWGRLLSQEQRDRWNVAGPQAMTHPRLGSGPLTGEQHFEQINSVLGRVGLPFLWEPPARVVFGLSPVGQLAITNDENGVRLRLAVNGMPTEDIMVFGQEPCPAGRSKRRNVSYLGLLPPAENGMSEITNLYKAKYGEPRPGRKVFIVTCQQKNGWKGLGQETSEIVPGEPEGQQATLKSAIPGAADTAEVATSQEPLMHKGCAPGAQGTDKPVVSLIPEGRSVGGGDRIAAGAASEGRKVPPEEGDAPV